MNDDMDVIRKNLAKAINDSKLTRSKLGALSGVSYQHLARFLNNTRGGEIGIGILKRVARVLNLPTSYLLGETDKLGNPILLSGDDRLPEKWDILFKEVLNLPEDKQELVYTILFASVSGFKK